MTWKTIYPNLYELFAASDTQHPENYFARMDDFQHLQGAQAYRDLENGFARLDQKSRQQIIERAAPLVTGRDTTKGRHWTALFETLNEIQGYIYLQDLGFSNIRFIPRTSHRTPDLHGEALSGDALLEVKTVNVSDNDVLLVGTVQKACYGLPEEFKRKLAWDYATARDQLHSLSVREPTRRICYFFITIDFQLALARSNQQALNDFFASIEQDCEIYHHSQYW
jgi:hypothetical protein